MVINDIELCEPAEEAVVRVRLEVNDPLERAIVLAVRLVELDANPKPVRELRVPHKLYYSQHLARLTVHNTPCSGYHAAPLRCEHVTAV